MMSTVKKGNSLKRQKLKQRKSIEKLFERLRDTSSCSHQDSVIVINDSITEDTPLTKRKLSEEDLNVKRICTNINLSHPIVIHDDEDDCVSPKNDKPFASSTPKLKEIKKSRLQKSSLNVSGVSTLKNVDLIKELNDDINDLTNDIRKGSVAAIDLTKESSELNHTVIDLSNDNDNGECTVVSRISSNLSMSGDSDVTVINTAKRKRVENKMQDLFKGINKLNATEKGKLLEMITQNIFNGCKMTGKRTAPIAKDMVNRATDSLEDSYIKEVILGQTPSKNSIGSNIYNPQKDTKNKTGLRMVVIDGSNVAMSYSKGREFSVSALKTCIDYFLKRGHAVKAFVPRFRCKYGKSSNPRQLDDLERQGVVVYTPSREVQGRNICSYDDRYIVQCAAEFEGVIVSGDNYRDLLLENQRWRSVIENRLLQFTWVGDMIMFPRDPLGRYGPSLERFLTHD